MEGLKELINAIQRIEEPLTVFDERIFTEIVEKVTVKAADKVMFRLTGGIGIMESMRVMER